MLASIEAGPPILAAATLDPDPPAPGSLGDRLSPQSAPQPVRHQAADPNLAATTGVRGLSRRTKIALIAGAIALVAVIAAAIGISALGKHGLSESSPTSSARSYGAQIVLPFIGLENPLGVAVDSTGTVYITDRDRVLKLAAGSSAQQVLPFTGLNSPAGVAVDSVGIVYVTDINNNRVL